MGKTLEQFAGRRRTAALAELAADLREFSHDGLTQLLTDLEAEAVVRGSWDGCVISYRRGSAGSARGDRLGRRRNGFTDLWDGGWITGEEVRGAVRRELTRRGTAGSGARTASPCTRVAAPSSAPGSSSSVRRMAPPL